MQDKRPVVEGFIASTIDGYIARSNGDIDWLNHDALGEDYGYSDLRARIDALLIGRKTYDVVAAMDVDWPYAGLDTTVWSRSLTTGDLPAELQRHSVSASALPPEKLLQMLWERGLRRVWVDGGQTLQAFLSAGLVDRLTISTIPVLIGGGIPLFGPLDADQRLTLEKTRGYASGVVQMVYRLA